MIYNTSLDSKITKKHHVDNKLSSETSSNNSLKVNKSVLQETKNRKKSHRKHLKNGISWAENDVTIPGISKYIIGGENVRVDLRSNQRVPILNENDEVLKKLGCRLGFSIKNKSSKMKLKSKKVNVERKTSILKEVTSNKEINLNGYPIKHHRIISISGPIKEPRFSLYESEGPEKIAFEEVKHDFNNSTNNHKGYFSFRGLPSYSNSMASLETFPALRKDHRTEDLRSGIPYKSYPPRPYSPGPCSGSESGLENSYHDFYMSRSPGMSCRKGHTNNINDKNAYEPHLNINPKYSNSSFTDLTTDCSSFHPPGIMYSLKNKLSDTFMHKIPLKSNLYSGESTLNLKLKKKKRQFDHTYQQMAARNSHPQHACPPYPPYTKPSMLPCPIVQPCKPQQTSVCPRTNCHCVCNGETYSALSSDYAKCISSLPKLDDDSVDDGEQKKEKTSAENKNKCCHNTNACFADCFPDGDLPIFNYPAIPQPQRTKDTCDQRIICNKMTNLLERLLDPNNNKGTQCCSTPEAEKKHILKNEYNENKRSFTCRETPVRIETPFGDESCVKQLESKKETGQNCCIDTSCSTEMDNMNEGNMSHRNPSKSFALKCFETQMERLSNKSSLFESDREEKPWKLQSCNGHMTNKVLHDKVVQTKHSKVNCYQKNEVEGKESQNSKPLCSCFYHNFAPTLAEKCPQLSCNYQEKDFPHFLQKQCSLNEAVIPEEKSTSLFKPASVEQRRCKEPSTTTYNAKANDTLHKEVCFVNIHDNDEDKKREQQCLYPRLDNPIPKVNSSPPTALKCDLCTEFLVKNKDNEGWDQEINDQHQINFDHIQTKTSQVCGSDRQPNYAASNTQQPQQQNLQFNTSKSCPSKLKYTLSKKTNVSVTKKNPFERWLQGQTLCQNPDGSNLLKNSDYLMPSNIKRYFNDDNSDQNSFPKQKYCIKTMSSCPQQQQHQQNHTRQQHSQQQCRQNKSRESSGAKARSTNTSSQECKTPHAKDDSNVFCSDYSPSKGKRNTKLFEKRLVRGEENTRKEKRRECIETDGRVQNRRSRHERDRDKSSEGSNNSRIKDRDKNTDGRRKDWRDAEREGSFTEVEKKIKYKESADNRDSIDRHTGSDDSFTNRIECSDVNNRSIQYDDNRGRRRDNYSRKKDTFRRESCERPDSSDDDPCYSEVRSKKRNCEKNIHRKRNINSVEDNTQNIGKSEKTYSEKNHSATKKRIDFYANCEHSNYDRNSTRYTCSCNPRRTLGPPTDFKFCQELKINRGARQTPDLTQERVSQQWYSQSNQKIKQEYGECVPRADDWFADAVSKQPDCPIHYLKTNAFTDTNMSVQTFNCPIVDFPKLNKPVMRRHVDKTLNAFSCSNPVDDLQYSGAANRQVNLPPKIGNIPVCQQHNPEEFLLIKSPEMKPYEKLIPNRLTKQNLYCQLQKSNYPPDNECIRKCIISKNTIPGSLKKPCKPFPLSVESTESIKCLRNTPKKIENTRTRWSECPRTRRSRSHKSQHSYSSKTRQPDYTRTSVRSENERNRRCQHYSSESQNSSIPKDSEQVVNRKKVLESDRKTTSKIDSVDHDCIFNKPSYSNRSSKIRTKAPAYNHESARENPSQRSKQKECNLKSDYPSQKSYRGGNEPKNENIKLKTKRKENHSKSNEKQKLTTNSGNFQKAKKMMSKSDSIDHDSSSSNNITRSSTNRQDFSCMHESARENPSKRSKQTKNSSKSEHRSKNSNLGGNEPQNENIGQKTKREENFSSNSFQELPKNVKENFKKDSLRGIRKIHKIYSIKQTMNEQQQEEFDQVVDSEDLQDKP